jgi:hypothetical protein
MYGGYDDADFGCDWEESEYDPEEEWDDYEDLDPSDYEIDTGYREDYDEDDTNWEPHSHDEQDDSDLDGLLVDEDDYDEEDEPDDYDDES